MDPVEPPLWGVLWTPQSPHGAPKPRETHGPHRAPILGCPKHPTDPPTPGSTMDLTEPAWPLQHLPPHCSLQPPGGPPGLAPPTPLTLPSAPLQSRDRKVLGDYSGALSYGSTAKYLNITALLLNIFLVILVIALVASGTVVMVNLLNQECQALFNLEHQSLPGPT
uniref:Uncharacterized protein n=1 Tax=Athene cunicularia TaxID=194338 RepID=A0A663M2S9_ATHCN